MPRLRANHPPVLLAGNGLTTYYGRVALLKGKNVDEIAKGTVLQALALMSSSAWNNTSTHDAEMALTYANLVRGELGLPAIKPGAGL